MEYKKKKTKIVCTLGPAVGNAEKIADLIENGMNVALLDFGLHSKKQNKDFFKHYKEANKKVGHKFCALMINLRGFTSRLGEIKDCPRQIAACQSVHLVSSREEANGEDKVYFDCSRFGDLEEDSHLVFGNQGLRGKILSSSSSSLEISFITSGELKSNCSVTLPQAEEEALVSEEDEDVLVNVALKEKADFICVPYINFADQIEEVRDLLGPRGEKVKIIASIDSKEGLENFDDILAESDGVMFSRDFFSDQFASEKIFIMQKFMIDKANALGKPVIVNTGCKEMLLTQGEASRTDATDFANAVIDGADAICLGREVAYGKQPDKAVIEVAKILSEAEQCINYELSHDNIVRATKIVSTQEAICAAAVKTASDTVKS